MYSICFLTCLKKQTMINYRYCNMEKFKSFLKTYYVKLVELAIFILFFTLTQIVQFSFMFSTPLPKLFFLDFLIVFITGFIIFFFKKTIFDRFWLISWMSLYLLLSIANVSYNNVSGDIFSLFNLTMTTEGMSLIFDASFYNWTFMGIIITLYVVFVLALILINVFKFKTEEIKTMSKRKALTVSLITVLSIGVYAGSLGTVKYIHKKNGYGLKDKIITLNKVSNFLEYGTLSYYFQELAYLISGAPLLGDEDMLNYFRQEIDAKNAYTGLLGPDTNVFTIMIETGDDLMLNKTLTPNLYELTQNGINCVNNVSKNKTNISEFIGITGSAPSAGIIEASWYDYKLPYALPSMLSNHDTYFIHDTGADPDGKNNRDIYSRKELMPKLEFDNIYFHEDIYPDTPIWHWGGNYGLDSITLDKVSNMILNNNDDKPMYAFITSLSMHGPYVRPSNEALLRSKYEAKLKEAIKNGEWENPLKDTPNEKCIEIYMMEAMDFDVGLGKIIDNLKAANEYDNTLFVLYGDHEIYYKGEDGKSLNLALSGHDEFSYYDIYKTVLTFSHPKLNSVYHKTFNTNEFNILTSPYNIAPTILDLLGIKYNPNFYVGSSIFAPQMFNEPQIFRSIELSASFNEYLWTENNIDIVNQFVDEISDEYLEAFFKKSDKVVEKLGYIDIIITKDYFTDRDFSYYIN